MLLGTTLIKGDQKIIREDTRWQSLVEFDVVFRAVNSQISIVKCFESQFN